MPIKIRPFIGELKRRHVFKVAVVYALAAWVLIQVANNVFPPLHLPPSAVTLVVVLAIAGFPLALVLAWAYELTPEGVRPTASAPAAPPDTPSAAEREEDPRQPPPANTALAAIAVLQFTNLTPGKPYAYLADAIGTELHLLLSRVHQLRVVSRRSAIAHSAADSDLRQIARELNVQYVICGSVAQLDGKIRINVELDDARDDSLLWSDRYDVPVDEAGSMQREIAETIVSVFGGERLRAEVKHANEASPASASAWQIVQRARAYLLDYKPETVAAAVPLLRRAVELDPEYAVAHAMLGLVTAEMTLNALSEDAAADRAAAVAAISRAEQLAPRDPVVLRAAGCVRAYTGDYGHSIELLRRAVKLAPYDLGTWGYLGWPLVATGDPRDLREAHEIVDRLLRVSPKHPGRAYWLFHKSVAYVCGDDCKQAVEYAEEYLAEQPRFSLGLLSYANALGRLERFDAARAAAESCAAINSRMTPAYYAALMAVLSDREAVIDRRTSGLHAAGLTGR